MARLSMFSQSVENDALTTPSVNSLYAFLQLWPLKSCVDQVYDEWANHFE